MTLFKHYSQTNYLQKIVDGVETGEWHHPETSQEYLKWLEEGNTPEPADEIKNT